MRLNWAGSQGVNAINNLGENVRQVAIGPSHIAILTEDGRVARLVFSINTDALDLNKADTTKGLVIIEFLVQQSISLRIY